ncbi:MAG: 3-methyl-2-oxobutanoate hydroxymethyltransferase [Phycisphaerales bacterium]|nr:MAG: 3-methyl-2-oxobutanoate hydroxymethyltransferase [Phycisphaerales bacterium]
MTAQTNGSKTTIATLRRFKRDRRKIAMLTCYDYSTARLMEKAGVESILVGDTYGEVCLGHATTLPVTVEHLVTITEAVRRGAPSTFLVGDMPFLSYQVSIEEAIRNAGAFMARAGCDCVKLEVDRRHLATVEALSAASIPVMAHLGLRPQSIHHLGGYKVQGRLAEDARRILEDADSMETAGAVALLLEAVPAELARMVSESTQLPVIGCASGPFCDGQVVVLHDMLGYGAGHPPRSVKQYANLHDELVRAFSAYCEDVHQGVFPTEEQSAAMPPVEFERLRAWRAANRAAPEPTSLADPQ